MSSPKQSDIPASALEQELQRLQNLTRDFEIASQVVLALGDPDESRYCGIFYDKSFHENSVAAWARERKKMKAYLRPPWETVCESSRKIYTRLSDIFDVHFAIHHVGTVAVKFFPKGETDLPPHCPPAPEEITRFPGDIAAARGEAPFGLDTIYPPDIEAEITFLTGSEGGRHLPVRSRYRPQFNYDRHDWDADHEYPDVEWVYPGQTVRALLRFLNPVAHVDRVYPGMEFLIREKYQIVARGRVTKILQLAESAERVRSKG